LDHGWKSSRVWPISVPCGLLPSQCESRTIIPSSLVLVRLSIAGRAPCRHRHGRPGAEMRSPSVRKLKKREQRHREQCRSEAVASPADDDLKPVRACAALPIRIRDSAPIHKKTPKEEKNTTPLSTFKHHSHTHLFCASSTARPPAIGRGQQQRDGASPREETRRCSQVWR
jgi:hypothetical protein